MAKKVLIIATSPRKNGNSSRLAQEFEKGAISSGNEVEIVYLCEKQISFCKGCFSCQKFNKCVIDDDANLINEKISNSDVVVWATPVYYYCMSGQMKTMIDRTNPLFSIKNKFKEVYLLATAAENEETAMDGTVVGLNGWIDCHNGVELKGVIKATGVTNIGDIEGDSNLQEAYKLGKSII